MPEGSIYYFRATAYDSAGHESTFSNLAVSEWLPAPLAPAMNETLASPAVLVWSTPPEDLNLTFSVLFGTDPKLSINTKVKGKGRSKKFSTVMPTRLITGLTDTNHTIGDLISGVSYYWQVIATDDNGQQFKSIISSFVAE